MTKIIQSIYFHILTTLKPFLLFIGKIYPKFSSKEHIFEQLTTIKALLVPGDIILTKSDAHLSNITNLGYWKHGLIYMGTEEVIVNNRKMEEHIIVEAIGEGVVKRTLEEMLASKDRILIIRATDKLLDENKFLEAVKCWDNFFTFVKEQIGKPYDYSFDSFSNRSHESFYCTELIYKAFKYAFPLSNFDLRPTYGILTVTPMDLFNMIAKGKFEKILEIKR